jgi:hypothetical protein
LLSALFSAEHAGQVFMGHPAPFAAPSLHSRFVVIATDSENGVILAERFRETTRESRLNGEKTCQVSG